MSSYACKAISKLVFLIGVVIGVEYANARPHPVIGRAQLVGRDTALADAYDYIVVGGGTSGLAVADRLTEDVTKTVLVIESGNLDDQEPFIVVPGLYVDNSSQNPKYLFPLTSTPQANINNRTAGFYAGHVVGGGTTVNGMVFDRGAKGDYDLWEELGNPGWGWEGLLPYFRKSETFHPQKPALAKQAGKSFPFGNDVTAHGYEGPVQSSMPGFIYPGTIAAFEAWKQLGIPYIPDSTDGNSIGLFWLPGSVDPTNYTRSYARTAHYEPIKQRKNFHLLTGNMVTKILFEGPENRATGVLFTNTNATANLGITTTKVSARREVTLAAGTAHTPQLLQLSGIGPKELLHSLGIEVLVDLEGVGQNFQDHPAMYFAGEFANDFSLNPGNLTTNATFAAEMLKLYYAKGEGPYTLARGLGGAFPTLSQVLSSSNQTLQSFLHANNLQSPSTSHARQSPVSLGQQTQRSLLITYHLNSRLAIDESAFAGDLSGLAVALLKPLSRGSIHINTTSPLSPPVINYNILSHPFDLAVLVSMINFNRKVYSTPAMRRLKHTLTFPDDSVKTDEELREWIRSNLQASYAHPCCTAAMMPRAFGGVVDPGLAVYGTAGLRVVDASLMPVVPGTHLSSTVYAVAEKAADIIKKAATGRGATKLS